MVEVLRPQLAGLAAVVHEALEHGICLNSGLIDLDVWLEAADGIEPPGSRICDHVGRDRDGYRDVHLPARLQSPELRGRDPDDRVNAIAESDGLADGVRRAAESPLPVAVADHRDRRIQLFVSLRQHAAQSRLQSEDVVVVAGSNLTEYLLERAVHADAKLVDRKRGNSVECGRFFSNAVEAGIGRRPAGTRSSGCLQEHELVRPVHRERSQQHRIDQAEDGRVGADAKRERQEGRQGKRRRSDQQSRAVT